MSQLFKNFVLYNEFTNKVKQNVKLFHIWKDFWTDNTFGVFVTEEDKAYGFGENCVGQLGQGHNNNVDEFVEINEISGKNICEFFEGNCCLFARNSNYEIFSWGGNNWSQLGRGFISDLDIYFKPEKIEFLSSKSIIEISCGDLHNMALTLDGSVYSWGDNSFGQICCEPNQYIIGTPSLIEFKENFDSIKSIYCFSNTSFAITEKDSVYFWGENLWTPESTSDEILKIYQPQLLENIKASKIVYNTESIFFLFNGKITEYRKGEFKEFDLPEIIDVCVNENHELICETSQQLWKLSEKGFIEVNYKNIFEYYMNEYQSTYKTIDSKFMKNYQNINAETLKKFDDIDINLYSKGKFSNNFTVINIFPSKIFNPGQMVFKVKNKNNKKVFIVKHVVIKNDLRDIIGELQRISLLDSNFICEIKDYWIENYNYLFIQLNSYDFNLKYIMKIRSNHFKRSKTEQMSQIEYFIASELFKELIDCLNYLHSLTPPITHRDLKPSNIMITNGLNGRFVKLSDIALGPGLITSQSENVKESIDVFDVHSKRLNKLHQKRSQSYSIDRKPKQNVDQNHTNYLAPEVTNGDHYNTKADTYSLAMIAIDLFELNSKELTVKPNIKLSKNDNVQSELNENLALCLRPINYNERLSCEEVLTLFKKCSIDKSVILKDEKLPQVKENLSRAKCGFFLKFLLSKLQ